MKFLNFDKVLVLSPHPDDAEYSMLGTMIRFTDTVFDVMVMSHGGDFDDSSSIERHMECAEIFNSFENINGIFAPIKFIKDYNEDQLVNLVESTMNMAVYNCIMVPPETDSHFEHRQISTLAFPLIRRQKCGIIHYRTVSSLETFVSNLFIDIEGNVYEQKLEQLQKFASQNEKFFFKKGPIDSFHKNFSCAKRGMGNVESFKIIKIYD